MSKTGIAQDVIKGLTLVPIAVLLFYSDPSGWFASLHNSPYLALLVGGFTLLTCFTVMKRRILSAYLEIGKGNLVFGLILLIASAAAYISGYYVGNLAWFHFQSLVLLVASYICFRFDPRIVKTLGLPLVIVSLSFPLPQVLQYSGYLVAAVYVLIVSVGFSALMARKNFEIVLISALVSGLSVLYMLRPAFWVAPYLIPLSLLLFLPSVLRGWQRRRIASYVFGEGEEAHQVEGGFCLLCGRKISSSYRPGSSGFVGLAVTLLVVYVIFTFQVPTLSYHGNAPFSNLYSRTGVVSAPIPQTPPGWLMNSSDPFRAPADTFSEKIVYVPAVNPERANYTLFYELSQGSTQITASWGDKPGWVFKGSNDVTVAGITGHLVTYESPGRLMLVFIGNTRLLLQDTGGFTLFNVGMSFQRQFEGVSVNQATSALTSDLGTIFLPTVNAYDYNSVWTNFLYRADSAFQTLQPYLQLGAISVLILYGTYRVLAHDSRNERFRTRAAELEDEDWKKLAGQLGQRRKSRTGFEIARLAGPQGQEAKPGDILAYLKRLERSGMIRRVVTERGSEVFLLWKLST